MNQESSAELALALSRRTLLKHFARAGAAFVMLPRALRDVLAAGPSAAQVRPPVISFYMDRPYLDHTGMAIPYFWPRGTHSGAPLARLSEEAFRRAQLYV